MGADILNGILLAFQSASEHQATALIALLEPSLLFFLKFGLLLTFASLMFNHAGLFAVLFRSTLYLGLCHFVFLEGWVLTREMFFGVSHVSQRLGVPATNPSAIIALGAYVADPLLKSVGSQGLTTFLWHPTTVIWSLAGFAVFFAFCILALIQFSFHLFGSILIGAAPFFLLFLPVPVLNLISHKWIQLVAGTMAGLFVTGLIVGITNDLSVWMANSFRASFQDAAAGGVTLTAADYAIPWGTAIVMAIAFSYIPLKFSAAGAGVAGNLMAGVSGLVSLATNASTAVTMPTSGGGGSLSGSGSQSSIDGSGSSTGIGSNGSGGGLAPAVAPAKGSWS